MTLHEQFKLWWDLNKEHFKCGEYEAFEIWLAASTTIKQNELVDYFMLSKLECIVYQLDRYGLLMLARQDQDLYKKALRSL